MSENYSSRDDLSEDDQYSYDSLIEDGYNPPAVLKYLKNCDDDFDGALNDLHDSLEQQYEEGIHTDTKPEDDTPEAEPSEKPPVDIMALVEQELEGL